MPPSNEPSRELHRRLRLPLNGAVRVAAGLVFLVAVGGLLWWRHGNLAAIGNAFSEVRWEWVVAAIALNLLSVVVRALAWTTVIHSAMEPPHPRVLLVFSATRRGLDPEIARA